MLRAHTHAYIY